MLCGLTPKVYIHLHLLYNNYNYAHMTDENKVLIDCLFSEHIVTIQ